MQVSPELECGQGDDTRCGCSQYPVTDRHGAGTGLGQLTELVGIDATLWTNDDQHRTGRRKLDVGKRLLSFLMQQ